MTPSFTEAAFLSIAALVAGTLDAIAGGGGLITVPALFFAMPASATHFALGTNKGQAVFGSGAALLKYAHSGLIDWKRAIPAFLLGLVGSLLGAQLALVIPPAKLKPIVVVLLFLVAVYLTFRRKPSPDAKPVEPKPALAAAAAFLIGAYDGFIGPGTGTFLIIAFVALMGDSMARASANAKVVNFASNLAALAAFWWKGKVVWAYAVPMAMAQIVGGFIGAHLAVKVGDTLVRRVVLVVSVLLILKVSYDIAQG